MNIIPRSLAHFGSLGPALLCLWALPGCSSTDTVDSQTKTESLAPDRAQELDDFVRSALARYDVPGAALAIIENGAVVHSAGFGVRGADDARPVTPETRFMVGSITKSMTSLMMASLADEGKLDWDAPVAKLVPAFALSDPASTPLVRMRDLVNHSSGVPRYDTPLEVQYFPPTDLIDSLREIPVVAPPGKVFGYSNQMYATGGYVAAYLAGAAYESAALEAGFAEQLEQRVFEPIGMPRTTLDFDAAITDSNHALPNDYDPANDVVAAVPVDYERFTRSVAPAGAVWSDIDDMARYTVAQLTGDSPEGRSVVSQANLEETHRANISAAPGLSYALGWVAQEDYLGQPAVWHDGGTVGFTANLLLLPEQQLGVVLLTNRGGADPFYKAVTQFAAETLLGREHTDDAEALAAEIDQRESLRQVVAQTSIAEESAVSVYLGSYEHHARAAFSEAGFTLDGDFGPLPLRATATPGIFVTGSVVTGMLIAQFDTSTGTPQVALGAPGEAGLDQVLELKRLGE